MIEPLSPAFQSGLRISDLLIPAHPSLRIQRQNPTMRRKQRFTTIRIGNILLNIYEYFVRGFDTHINSVDVIR